MTGTPRATGAYGFRFTGLEIPAPPLNHVAEDAPEITLLAERSTSPDVVREVTHDRVVLPLIGGGSVRMLREPSGAVIATPQPLTAAALAHPYLAPVAGTHALWRGWLAMHAGGIVIGDGVWGVTGPRNAGKSSFLAACALRGLPVVADDLLVLDGGRVHPGPRSLDLRSDAARELGVGVDIGYVGMRERWRFDLQPLEAVPRFAGWLFLTWGPDVWMGEVSVRDRARRLRSKNAVPGLQPDPARFLRMVNRPCFSIHRPQDWISLDATIDLVVDRLS